MQGYRHIPMEDDDHEDIIHTPEVPKGTPEQPNPTKRSRTAPRPWTPEEDAVLSEGIVHGPIIG